MMIYAINKKEIIKTKLLLKTKFQNQADKQKRQKILTTEMMNSKERRQSVESREAPVEKAHCRRHAEKN